MLRSLRITDFAIIDNLEIDFDSGMCALTGETGAGKSIIIDAIGLILGGRAYTEFIRSGAAEARVEALFDITDRPDVVERLRQRDLDAESELIIRRTISQKGPNRADINGRMTPVGLLAEITSGLVDIYGQHEHHSLLKPESHLDTLDEFGGLKEIAAKYRAAWNAMREIRKKIDDAGKHESERASRLDYLKFVIAEINSANIVAGEMERLREERDVLRNSRQLVEAGMNAYEALYGVEDAISARLNAISESLLKASRLDSRLVPIAEAIRSAKYSIEDAANIARNYAERIEENPARLDEIGDRLDIIVKLCKKYGGSTEDALKHRDMCDEEIARLEKGEKNIDELRINLEEQRKSALETAQTLTAGRLDAAGNLRKSAEKELAELGMAKSRFEMRLAPSAETDGLGPDGAETGEFFLTTNPGEELKPLVKVASGGELSRIMLALKKILAGAADVPTLIFDEVDSGVGGAAAEVVGRKLKSLSGRAQVFCVTHLAQIAALADSHYYVTKSEVKNRTVTRIKVLDYTERTEEVARMLGGVEVTNATRTLAMEMIDGARSKK